MDDFTSPTKTRTTSSAFTFLWDFSYRTYVWFENCFFYFVEVQRGSAVEIPKLNAPLPEKIIPSDGKVHGERMDQSGGDLTRTAIDLSGSGSRRVFALNLSVCAASPPCSGLCVTLNYTDLDHIPSQWCFLQGFLCYMAQIGHFSLVGRFSRPS